MSTHHVTNFIIINLISLNPDYPWYSYIANSQSQFEEALPRILKQISDPKVIQIYINTDDETITIEEQTEIPDIDPDLSSTIDGITYNFYMD